MKARRDRDSLNVFHGGVGRSNTTKAKTTSRQYWWRKARNFRLFRLLPLSRSSSGSMISRLRLIVDDCLGSDKEKKNGKCHAI
jgi:hypothetical protein